MNNIFLSNIIEKYSKPGIEIYISDSNSRILVSSNPTRIGTIGNTAKYVISTMQSANIKNSKLENSSYIYYGVPIHLKDTIIYVVVVKGEYNVCIDTGNTLEQVLESTLEYDTFLKLHINEKKDKLNEIASQLLSEHFNKDQLIPVMYKYELDPCLLRSVIYIHLDFYKNSYFNINLSLGYEASIEQLRQTLIDNISKSKYLNSQDLVYMQNRNTIIIIKSFLKTNDISTLYKALEAVCQNLFEVLNKHSGFSFYISYGGISDDINNIYQSMNEASLICELGEKNGSISFCKLSSLLFDYMSAHMTPLVTNQLILPILQNLFINDNDFRDSLLDTAETFVDCCMNLSATADSLNIHRNTVNTRLLKFEKLTGLFPATNFKDAILVKLTATYLKQEKQKENIE